MEDEDDGEVIYINMYDTEKVDKNSIVATEDDSKDPKFTDFDINAVRLLDYQLFNNDGTQKYDFHVQAGSPVLMVLTMGNDATMQPYFASRSGSKWSDLYLSESGSSLRSIRYKIITSFSRFC